MWFEILCEFQRRIEIHLQYIDALEKVQFHRVSAFCKLLEPFWAKLAIKTLSQSTF